MSKSINEIWLDCVIAESERNETRFLKAVTLETQDCYLCGFINRGRFKAEYNRTETENALFEKLKAMPGFKSEPESQEMILKKSDDVWCYLCRRCAKKNPTGFE